MIALVYVWGSAATVAVTALVHFILGADWMLGISTGFAWGVAVGTWVQLWVSGLGRMKERPALTALFLVLALSAANVQVPLLQGLPYWTRYALSLLILGVAFASVNIGKLMAYLAQSEGQKRSQTEPKK